jgi:AraC-like DNA-binding protein
MNTTPKYPRKNFFTTNQSASDIVVRNSADAYLFENNQYDGPSWMQAFATAIKGNFDGHIYTPSPSVGSGCIHTGSLLAGASYLLFNCQFNKDIALTFNEVDAQKGVLLFNPQDIGLADEKHIEKYKRGFMRFLQGLYFTDSSQSKMFSFAARSQVKLLMIFFDKKWFRETYRNECQEEDCSDIIGDLTAQRGFIHHQLTPDLRIYLKQLFETNTTHAMTSIAEQAKILTIFESGLKKIMDTQSAVEHARISEEDKELLLAAEKLLLSDFSKTPPTIRELARLSYMSETSFKIKFKRMFGMNVYEYFQHFRLHKAKELLETHQYSIKEVGFRIGYTNMSHFSRNFRLKFGLLPSQI